MAATTTQAARDELLALARNPKDTPFDYIVIGSGAGGGPLAARLALGGRRVLVLEAGTDPALGPDGKPVRKALDDASNGMREVYAVPAFHAAATEDPDMSWTFSVRHYDDDARQQRDSKYDKARDPSAMAGAGDHKGGIQYPRTAALGGCTAHHAMIIIRPNDTDWDWIAERTNDPSWRSEHMQGYFPKIEKCLYYSVYKTFLHKGLGVLVKLAYRIATLVNPRRQLDPGGHGEHGWQPTSFIDPLVIAGIVRGDRTFLRVLLDVSLATLGGKSDRMVLLRSLLHLQLLRFLDPNVRSPDIPSRAHLSLISIGTDGKRRFGLREHLLDIAKQRPQHLVLATGVHATRLLFEAGAAGDPPRAIGVEVMQGAHLYRASPLAPSTTPAATRVQYFARREVIVCGGAFNTPQLLMLSGIGDRNALGRFNIAGPRDRDGNEVAPIVHLPGVGRHLQDRYEVSVVSEAERNFSTLDGVGFAPDAPDDPAAQQWRKDGSGLYSINGGALAMMMSSTGSQAVRRDPDLFIFGVPAAFRGYYWNWSKELLRKTQGADTDVRNLWTWVILKAYTSNNGGTVRLRSADPLDTPQIDFHSFDDLASADFQGDLDALGEAIAKVREINAKVKVFKDEVQPAATRPDGSRQLADWIKDEAWGHHACGTCRIGVDRWSGDAAGLTEADAVLASDFRVHGVAGLRVVDASVFPRIPGYFIVTPTFMIGEKAADELLADRLDYPRELAQKEAAELRERRVVAGSAVPHAAQASEGLPADTIGLALSGGGIRSATFCLGVLQALAIRKKLRHIDVLSSVSGGGYIAAFLGMLYARLETCVADKAGRVESILSNMASPEIWWLRRHANYIDSGARGDLQTDVGIVLRNLAFVHLWLGAMVFGFFGLARWFAAARLADLALPWTVFGFTPSLWWWLPVGVLLFGVVPLASGYWLVLKDSPEGHRVPSPLVLWVVLLGCAVFGLGHAATQPWSVLGLVVLLLAWAAQEIASWGLPVPDPDRARRGPALDPTQLPPTPLSTGIRSRLSRALGIAVFGFALSVLWVILDSLAQAAGASAVPWAGWSMLGLAPLLPMLRGLAVHLLRGDAAPGGAPSSGLTRLLVLGAVAFGLLLLLLFYLDTLAHLVFQRPGVGPWVVVTALLAAAVVGRTIAFLNLSSLQQSYAQKLLRTFLGASNDARVHPTGTDAPVPVNVPHPEDDIHFDEYRPQRNGGPLHLVGTCINDTVDRESGRQLRGDKGLPLCAGPAGLSVGLRHHALWGERAQDAAPHLAPVKPLRLVPDPNDFHVLARRDNKPVEVERLKLGQWMAISGAAYTTGSGRETTLAKSLLLGLLNIRIGYWWDTGIQAGDRPGRYPPSLWVWLKSLPARIFRVQATLLDEWRAWFPGASDRLWYLSDGGHFDNTGLYELIRRRLPFVIAVDAGRDAGVDHYEFDDLALVTRQVRLDFGATVQWIDPANLASAQVPPWILAHFKSSAIGRLGDLKRDGKRFAALARVDYVGAAPEAATWVLMLKPCLGAGIPIDVQNYAVRHPDFPQQSTFNQFFDDDQWEAYRMLGQVAGESVFL